MDTNSNLESFIQKIFSINPSYIDVFGKNLPGMSGTAIATQGATTSATDIMNKLREAVGSFAELKTGGASNERLTPLVKEIEGHLLMLETLDAVSNQLCESLIDELNTIAYE